MATKIIPVRDLRCSIQKSPHSKVPWGLERGGWPLSLVSAVAFDDGLNGAAEDFKVHRD